MKEMGQKLNGFITVTYGCKVMDRSTLVVCKLVFFPVFFCLLVKNGTEERFTIFKKMEF